MSRPITREEHLTFISEGIADVEAAVASHPVETLALFHQGMRELSQDCAPGKKLAEASVIPSEELALALRYLSATAFISAWYHVRGGKAKRDEATSPACLFVSALGFPPADVLHCFMEYERAWRASLRALPH